MQQKGQQCAKMCKKKQTIAKQIPLCACIFGKPLMAEADWPKARITPEMQKTWKNKDDKHRRHAKNKQRHHKNNNKKHTNTHNMEKQLKNK